ncbi:tyrosine-type recombinase/integrase [Dactylosporangium sp. CA-092794]|uniref:tyrosine-type recombinase/integrase n=1 Tax=Dactylosporangium sp. CA-092794 TaxID=3239929 RepID=UPI003D9386D3
MTADPARVAQAWKLLADLGVTLADLQRSAQPPRPAFDAYLPQVLAAAGPGALRAYRSYWQRMATTWAGIPIDAVTAGDIQALRQRVTDRARVRRNSRNGRHAGELLVAAARAFYNQAIADGLIQAADSPAHRVAKPRRLPSTRRALTPDELTDINAVARTTGNDTILDALLLRLHTETACRRGGALGLRLQDLDAERGLLLLREKGGTVRWQPISLELAANLRRHAAVRGAILPTDSLLRYTNGNALTSRRYDQLWHRIGQHLPWVATHGITAHWLRHTTLTWVERHFGYGVARAYAGHTDTTGPATTTYIRADLQAVAAALAAMTGLPHPLAGPSGDVSGGVLHA